MLVVLAGEVRLGVIRPVTVEDDDAVCESGGFDAGIVSGFPASSRLPSMGPPRNSVRS